MGALSISINLFTVCLYFLMGIVQGWANATLMPMVQRHADPAEQNTIVSMAKVAGQILYIPIVWLTGYAADISLNYAPLVTLIIFIPLGLLVIKTLNKKKP
jgi:cyanate permease